MSDDQAARPVEAAPAPAPVPVPAGDQLPADLDVTGYRGPYTFPDNSRRRIPGAIYLAAAAACLFAWVTRADGGVLVNDGLFFAAVLLGAVGAFHLAAGWHLRVRETDALVAASKKIGFPVGHASAQLSWRGLRSRPTWRILLYSAEDPPEQRGLVLVDGIDGSVVAHFVEANPEDWSVYSD
ncbi:MAG: hypothetical protein CYG61_09485 [Actinobacteria bacterium]|nr:MAG: hypothetical protein CYG61_09485 [Actinomycetota bacterium]